MKPQYPFIVLALVASTAFSGIPALAVAPKDATVVCDLKAPLEKLAQLKADASTSSVEKELELRKTLLHDSMDCNAREATAMAAAVASLQGSSQIADSLKRRYEGQLKDAATFAAAKRDSAAQLATVTSTKDAARDLRTWREQQYNPMAWEAAQLIVLDRNLALVESGEVRLERMEALADELATKDATTTAEVINNLKQAQDLIDNSSTALVRALTILKGSARTAQEEITSKQKEGLDGLSQAYRILLDSNTKIEEIAAR